jgi:hypothetical protein
MKAQFFVFTFGFFVPFFLQLFLVTDPGRVKYLNLLCLFTQFLFMTVEVFQILKQGRYYFYDFWNVVDIVLFFTYLVYFFGRIFDSGSSVLPLENDVMPAHAMFFWIIINHILLLNSVLSMLFFVRVYERFGLLVTLIGQVL